MDSYERIALFYDLEHDDFTDDVEFYRQMAPTDPVLEVGAGTGRLMEPLLELGLEVWGIDSSAAMLARASQRLSRFECSHLIQQDAECLDLPIRFGTVMLALNTLAHLRDQRAQLASLSAIRLHLKEDGLLIVDLSNPISMADRGASGEVRRRFTRAFEGGSVTGFSAVWDDESEQLLTVQLWYDGADQNGAVERTATQLCMRYLYRFELELLLRHTGFQVVQVYGSYDLEPYTAASPNLIAVARPT